MNGWFLHKHPVGRGIKLQANYSHIIAFLSLVNKDFSTGDHLPAELGEMCFSHGLFQFSMQ
jgi:hypothetical protein